MKLRTIIIIIIVFIIGLIILKNVGNKQKNETLENALQLDETSINVQEKDIKGSVEGNHKGIEISNIKLMGRRCPARAPWPDEEGSPPPDASPR